jgi:membrane-bound inhibitor of C-type lysozyme
MKQPYQIVGMIVLILALGVFGVYAYIHTQKPSTPTVTSTASYLCRDGKTIDAVYTVANVTLTLSDTRALILPQVQSGSGIRYESGGKVFVSKGSNAFLEEKGVQTYVDCVATGSQTNTNTPNGEKQFSDSAGTFVFMYPNTVTVSGAGVGYTQSWMSNASTSGLILAKATLGKAFQPKTNFSEATLTVGTSADPSAVATCLTYNPTGGPATVPTKETINGTTYAVLHSSDAGAGNRYDTTSYRTLRNNQCYVVEYTIHSTNIGNYDPSQGIKEFDAKAVTNIMNGIIQSFRFTDGA